MSDFSEGASRDILKIAPAETSANAQKSTPPKAETAAPSKTAEKNNATTSTNKKSRVIPKDKFVNVFDDSDENLGRLIAKWKKRTSKISAMPMFDPELWATGLEIGGIYIQRGINNFAD